MPAHPSSTAELTTGQAGGLGQGHLPFFFSKNRRLGREAGNAGGQKEKGGLGEMNFCPPAQSSGGGKAFPQFLHQQEGKTEKFSFP